MRRPGTCLRVFTAYILTRNSRLGLRSPFRTQMVAGPECLFLGFAMRRPGTCLRVSTAYILTRNSRLGSGWCVGGALAPGTTYTSEKAWFKLRHDQDGWCGARGRLLRIGVPNPGFWNAASRHPYPAYLPRTSWPKTVVWASPGLGGGWGGGWRVGPGPWECAVRVAIAAEVLQ